MSEPGPDAPHDGPADAGVDAGDPPEEPEPAGPAPAGATSPSATPPGAVAASNPGAAPDPPAARAPAGCEIAGYEIAGYDPAAREPAPPRQGPAAHEPVLCEPAFYEPAFHERALHERALQKPALHRPAPSAPALHTAPAPPAPAPLAPLLAAFVLDLLLAVALIAGLSVLGTLGWGFVQGLRGLDGAQTAPPLAAAMLITLSATAISALTVYYFRRNANAVERAASWRALWRASSWGWIAIAPIVLATCSTLIVATAIAQGLDVTPTNQVLGPAIRAQPVLWLTVAMLIAPAYEELLFRRVLFGRLWAAGRPGLGLVLSAVAFALVHEPPGLGAGRGAGIVVLWGVYAFIGAVLAWIYRRSGTLWVPYLAHVGNNLLACVPLLAAG